MFDHKAQAPSAKAGLSHLEEISLTEPIGITDMYNSRLEPTRRRMGGVSYQNKRTMNTVIRVYWRTLNHHGVSFHSL